MQQWRNEAEIKMESFCFEKEAICLHVTHKTNQHEYLIKFVPGGVEVLFDDLTLEGYSSHSDLHIRVTLSLYHATH